MIAIGKWNRQAGQAMKSEIQVEKVGAATVSDSESERGLTQQATDLGSSTQT